MKKKIMVLATGWGAEILHKYVNGALKRLKEDGADLYCFLNYALINDVPETRDAELNIFELAKQEKFDGALLFGNGLDFPNLFENLTTYCNENNIPVASCGKRNDNVYFVGSENYAGTKAMCNHLIEEHGVKKIVFMAGSRDNEDSNVRLRAISDSMREHGLTLGVDDVVYTNWNTSPASDYVTELVQQGKPFPDAICCANDSLAMMTCIACHNLGVAVPEQVKVTGFDYEYISQIFSPSISSVDQKFEEIGYASASLIMDLIAGKQCQKETLIPCQFRPTESCGCMASTDAEKTRKQLGAVKYLNEMNETSFDRKILRIERSLMYAQEADDLSRSFASLYSANHNYEGDTFFIMLEPTYYKTMSNHNIKHRTLGYSTEFELAYGMCNGEEVSPGNYSLREIEKLAEKKESRFFLFAPIHENENNYGFIIFCDDTVKIFEQSKMFRYVERLGMVLGKFHGNVSLKLLHRRLLEMTETDALTHVKNRTAYEAAESRINSLIKQKKINEFGIVICDVNNLKKVNDHLGHEAGDEYIINCCQFVCVHFKKSRVYRIGGDEFAVILENDDYKNRLEIMEHIREEMEKIAGSNVKDTEKTSVACGLSTYRSNSDISMADVFNRADARMYANKAEMKMQRV